MTGLTRPNDLEMEVSAPPRPWNRARPQRDAGPLSYPGCPALTSKPPSKIKTMRKLAHTPVGTKHLNSVVLGRPGAVSEAVADRQPGW
jgi:hypothetical protein